MQCLQSRPRVSAARRASPRSRATVQVVRAVKTADGPTIAIVGVTGAVGQEFLTVGGPHRPGGGQLARPRGPAGPRRRDHPPLARELPLQRVQPKATADGDSLCPPPRTRTLCRS